MLRVITDVEATKRLALLVRRHQKLVIHGERTIKALLPELDVVLYPQLHAAVRARLVALLDAMPPERIRPGLTEYPEQYLARVLAAKTAVLRCWVDEFLPLLLLHTVPPLWPPLRQLRDEAAVLLAEAAGATPGGQA